MPFHANALSFEATLDNGLLRVDTYYPIGGGFVVSEARTNARQNLKAFADFPYPIQTGAELLAHCRAQRKTISALVQENEHGRSGRTRRLTRSWRGSGTRC